MECSINIDEVVWVKDKDNKKNIFLVTKRKDGYYEIEVDIELLSDGKVIVFEEYYTYENENGDGEKIYIEKDFNKIDLTIDEVQYLIKKYIKEDFELKGIENMKGEE